MLVSLQVVDLLVAMCRAALQSPRKSIIFEPYPCVVDPHDPKTLAFSPKVSAPHFKWSDILFWNNGWISCGRGRVTTGCKKLSTASC